VTRVRVVLAACVVVSAWLPAVGIAHATAPVYDVTLLKAGPIEVTASHGASLATVAVQNTISAGGDDTCALVGEGSGRCWGSNSRYAAQGMLGNGTTTDSSVPVAVTGVTGAVAISVGDIHSCAVIKDGTARCWGDNYAGELGTGAWGGPQLTPVTVTDLRSAVAITSGANHTCALIRDGTARCWGSSYFGQLGDGHSYDNYPSPRKVVGLTRAVAISAGGDDTCALLDNRTVSCWGKGLGSTPAVISGVTDALAIAVSDPLACARLADGTVSCWENGWGTAPPAQPVKIAGLSGVTAIAVGAVNGCAVISDGAARCWGSNGWGQLGDGTTTDSSTPVTVSGLSRAVAITTDGTHTCARLRDASLRCWGLNSRGQLGDGTTIDRPVPVAVIGFP